MQVFLVKLNPEIIAQNYNDKSSSMACPLSNSFYMIQVVSHNVSKMHKHKLLSIVIRYHLTLFMHWNFDFHIWYLIDLFGLIVRNVLCQSLNWDDWIILIIQWELRLRFLGPTVGQQIDFSPRTKTHIEILKSWGVMFQLLWNL